MTHSRMTLPAEAVEPLRSEISRFNNLVEKVNLEDAAEKIGRLEAAIGSLPGLLAEARAKGYRYKRDLEARVQSATSRWTDLRWRLTESLERHKAVLDARATGVRVRLGMGQAAGADLSALESDATAAARDLERMYDEPTDEVEKVRRAVEDVLWTVTQGDAASFRLEQGEAYVEAVPANWKKEGDKDGVEGVLFLTDRRLVFEQREEVVTKRVLFIATQKQKVQELQWALPVESIADTKASKRGFLGKDDYLTVECQAGPFRTADIHLRGETGESWQGFIGRARSGSLEQELVGTATASAPAAPATPAQNWAVAMPALVRAADGIVQVRGYGSWQSAAAVAPDAVAFVNSTLARIFVDLLGASAPTLRCQQLRSLIPELETSLLAQAQPQLRALGVQLTAVSVKGLEATPSA